MTMHRYIVCLTNDKITILHNNFMTFICFTFKYIYVDCDFNTIGG